MFDAWGATGLITSGAFYAIAVPAVVLMGMSKSGFGAGFGALVVPMMALVVPVPQAAAIMLPLLAVMDFLGLRALWRQRDVALTRRLLPAGLLGVAVGALLFGALSAKVVAGMVGGLTLLFLAIRLIWPPRVDAPATPHWLGFLYATSSGFTSFVAHAGGPPIAFYLMPMRLPPVVYTATLAVFFTAVNLAKWLPYAWLGLIDRTNMLTSLVLMPLAPLGVWLGVTFVKRVSQTLFYRLINLGMLLTGCKLLFDGLR